MYVGVDDTDSVDGMCTTYLVSLLCRELNVRKLPYLVRLNPNIPYKTRGNAALVFETEHPRAKEKVCAMVEKHSMLDCRGTNPGIAFYDGAPTLSMKRFYRRAISELVSLDDARRIAKSSGIELVGFKNCRGLIGATAALGFHGSITYELIAYRKHSRGPRLVDAASVKRMDSLFYPRVFDSIDPTGKRILITPRGKDPICLGIRGVCERDVRLAWETIEVAEPIEAVQVFRTNQATCAHLRPKKIISVKPYDCAILSGTVSEKPRVIRGGHAIFKLEDSTGSIDCAAYKKTQTLRDGALSLSKGDEITVSGGIGLHENTLNLEKIKFKKISHRVLRIPCCCGRKMTSAGLNKGFKCRKCSKKISHDCVDFMGSRLSSGCYDSVPGSRRHLSKPCFLEKITLEKVNSL
jgi:tRNA(Ile2)-agmatinylcytidine synthase